MNMVYLVLGSDVKKAVNSKEKEYFIIDIFLELPAQGNDRKQMTFSWCLICTVTNCSLLPPHTNTLACYY